jgi:hypothetical protein
MKHILIAAALILSACTQGETTPAAAPHPVILQHMSAFNAQDAAAMAKVEHPDIEWFNVGGSEMSLEVAGRDNLTKSMQDFFKSPMKISGTLSGWSVNGNYVSVIETASWSTKSGDTKSQSALSVYELEDDLIRRVWYYPAVSN